MSRPAPFRANTAIIAALLALGAAAPVQARDYGQHGAVWRIAEPDLLAQIHAKLTALEANGATGRLNAELKRRTIARVERPRPVSGIAAATTTRRWQFDPTIALPSDIRDHAGRLIHARGTRVNPLDTVPLRGALLFLDGDDPAQIDWAIRSFPAPATKLILVRGSPLALMRSRQRRVYFDQDGTLTKHFGIRDVPASVEQRGRFLLVSEIALPPKLGARP